jgi:hypothetical protein
MKMTYRMILGLLLISLPAMLLAHGGMEHVTGVVKAIDATSVTVETVKHETMVVMLMPGTDVMKSGTASSKLTRFRSAPPKPRKSGF